MQHSDLKGLRGWLIFLGIGVVLSPLRTLAIYYPLYSEIFTDGTWDVLTDPSSAAYEPFFDVLLFGELALNGLILLISLYAVYLFFSHHYLFPKVFLALIIAGILFIFLDVWAVSLVFSEIPMFDSDTVVELARSLIFAVIWVPYILVSKRVKATFTERRVVREDAAAA